MQGGPRADRCPHTHGKVEGADGGWRHVLSSVHALHTPIVVLPTAARRLWRKPGPHHVPYGGFLVNKEPMLLQQQPSTTVALHPRLCEASNVVFIKCICLIIKIHDWTLANVLCTLWSHGSHCATPLSLIVHKTQRSLFGNVMGQGDWLRVIRRDRRK